VNGLGQTHAFVRASAEHLGCSQGSLLFWIATKLNALPAKAVPRPRTNTSDGAPPHPRPIHIKCAALTLRLAFGTARVWRRTPAAHRGFAATSTRRRTQSERRGITTKESPATGGARTDSRGASLRSG
jgi:hypothetical protein